MTKSQMAIKDKVVVVTGGARGIGRATGEAFLRAGARVALGDVELAEKTAAELAAATGGEVCGLALDVTSRSSFTAFLDEDDAMTDRMLDINLRGVLTGSKLAAQRLANRGGHIVNVASLAGVSPQAGVATYCATKHAVVGFSDALHAELAASGVGVTAVLPGIVRTELSAGHSVPRWLRPVAEVESEAVAAAIVAAVGGSASRVVVPRALGAMITTTGLLPRGIRRRLERRAHLDTAFTTVDPKVRDRYHRRIVGTG